MESFGQLNKQLESIYTNTEKENVQLKSRVQELEIDLKVYKAAVKNSAIEHEILKAQNESLQSKPILACIIDGDGCLFSNSLVSRGREGGREAASLLASNIQKTSKLEVICLIFFNKNGLLKLYNDLRIADFDTFNAFIAGFNSSHPLFLMVDCGPAKEAADAKLRSWTTHFANTPGCEILVGCSSDGGYSSMLSQLQTQGHFKKITILQSYTEAAFEIKRLNFTTIEFHGLFEKNKLVLGQTPKRGSSYSNGNHSSGYGNGGNTSSGYISGKEKGYNSGKEKVIPKEKAPAPVPTPKLQDIKPLIQLGRPISPLKSSFAAPKTTSSNLPTFIFDHPKPAPAVVAPSLSFAPVKSAKPSLSNPPTFSNSLFSTTTFNVKPTRDSPDSPANIIKASLAASTSSAKASASSLPSNNNKTAYNKAAAIAEAITQSRPRRVMIGRVKLIDPSKPLSKQKIPPCNEHYLDELKGCARTDCKFEHNFILTKKELAILKIDAKKSPCVMELKGIGKCNKKEVDCINGHSCPWKGKCAFGSSCKFSPGMHPKGWNRSARDADSDEYSTAEDSSD